jgi:hypothetical protein
VLLDGLTGFIVMGSCYFHLCFIGRFFWEKRSDSLHRFAELHSEISNCSYVILLFSELRAQLDTKFT